MKVNSKKKKKCKLENVIKYNLYYVNEDFEVRSGLYILASKNRSCVLRALELYLPPRAVSAPVPGAGDRWRLRVIELEGVCLYTTTPASRILYYHFHTSHLRNLLSLYIKRLHTKMSSI